MNLEWMAIRGSGLVAYVLLAGATIWGLLVATKALGPRRAKPTTWLHESLAIGALLASGVHMVALTMDEYIEFGPRDLFIPGVSTWRPLAVTFGVMTFYALALITISFYVKKRIGHAMWRGLHYTSFGTFVAAMLHGVMAGTDTEHPVVFGMYVATGAMVVLLVIVRFVQATTPAPRERARAGGTAPKPDSTPAATSAGQAVEARH